MKTRELIKLNDRYSIVEAAYEQKATEYVVCSNYDSTKEPGSQWNSGVYCYSLKSAIQYAAKHCYEPEYMYLVIECYSGSIEHKTFDSRDDATHYLNTRYEILSAEDGVIYCDVYENYNGELVAHIAYEEDLIDMKLIEIRI